MLQVGLIATIVGTPDVKSSQKGRSYLVFNVVVPGAREADRTQENPETGLFVRVMSFKYVEEYFRLLSQGDSVFVKGNVRVGTWEKNDGTTVPSVTVIASKITVNDMTFDEPMGYVGPQDVQQSAPQQAPVQNPHAQLPNEQVMNRSPQGPQQQQMPAHVQGNPTNPFSDDDIPF